MLHTEVKKLAQEIGNELQDAADTAASVARTVEESDHYTSLDAWRESIEYDGDELVCSLDILATRCDEASAALDAALRAKAAV